MSDELNFAQVFADFPQVLFPYDKSLPVKGWLVQGPKQQVVFWHSQVPMRARSTAIPTRSAGS